jgi:ketosteroid isomerase-like protein
VTVTTAIRRQRALALLEAIAAGDIDHIRALLAPDCCWDIPGFGVYDRETFLASLANTITLTDHRRFHNVIVTAEDNRVAVAADGEFRFRDGRDYNNRYHYLFEFSGDRIIRGVEYMDTALASNLFRGQQ